MRRRTKNIAPTDGKVKVVKRGFITGDIIDLIMKADSDAAQVQFDIPDWIRSDDDIQTLRNAWRFVKDNVTYIEDDAEKFQDVKSPARTMNDGFGDCKSFTILLIAILRQIGFENLDFRYAGYTYPSDHKKEDDTDYVHVYAVAAVNGKEIPVDATYYKFGVEPSNKILSMDKPATKPELRYLTGAPTQVSMTFETDKVVDFSKKAVIGIALWELLIKPVFGIGR